ncbi:hypothetical protein [Roseicyclus persicicus]|uniref:Uncharacterized protein n=1 Tax=Roseicyclus persicicus TaxID=2650661 RepID=A0A7X6H108_9RHOB|nr:hypothetical protein [Roseibacterium persicicum]NKX46066.1 hypothetical protein [Roseibacterium persicicum]
MRRALPALIALAALPAQAQDGAPVALDCTLTTLCLDAGTCRDWDQPLEIRGANGVWQVTWSDTGLPSDYELIADIPAPEGSLADTRLISLLYRNPETQSVQVVTVETGGGGLAVSGHQPQANPRGVTGYGTCEGAG